MLYINPTPHPKQTPPPCTPLPHPRSCTLPSPSMPWVGGGDQLYNPPLTHPTHPTPPPAPPSQLHAAFPLHALVGGGDQLYNDGVWSVPALKEWAVLEDQLSIPVFSYPNEWEFLPFLPGCVCVVWGDGGGWRII